MKDRTVDACFHCGARVQVRIRQFSERAVSALVRWGELQSDISNKAICQDCYAELREILIERTHEMEQAIG